MSIDITPSVTAGLTQAAANTNNDLSQKDVAAVSKTVSVEVQKETDAVITNITNQEPLWQSRNFWTSLAVIGASTAGLAGYSVSAEDQAAAVDSVMGAVQAGSLAVTFIGGLYALFNRIRAGKLKPLGQ